MASLQDVTVESGVMGVPVVEIRRRSLEDQDDGQRAQSCWWRGGAPWHRGPRGWQAHEVVAPLGLRVP